MHILIIPAGLILWYMAYEAKPSVNDDDEKYLWEEKNIDKRNRILGILNEIH